MRFLFRSFGRSARLHILNCNWGFVSMAARCAWGRGRRCPHVRIVEVPRRRRPFSWRPACTCPYSIYCAVRSRSRVPGMRWQLYTTHCRTSEHRRGDALLHSGHRELPSWGRAAIHTGPACVTYTRPILVPPDAVRPRSRPRGENGAHVPLPEFLEGGAAGGRCTGAGFLFPSMPSVRPGRAEHLRWRRALRDSCVAAP